MKLRSEGVSWQEIDGELVILDLQSSKYLTTNRTGAFLARLMSEEQSVDSMTSALVEEYKIDESRARTDAEAFTEALRDKNLLT